MSSERTDEDESASGRETRLEMGFLTREFWESLLDVNIAVHVERKKESDSFEILNVSVDPLTSLENVEIHCQINDMIKIEMFFDEDKIASLFIPVVDIIKRCHESGVSNIPSWKIENESYKKHLTVGFVILEEEEEEGENGEEEENEGEGEEEEEEEGEEDENSSMRKLKKKSTFLLQKALRMFASGGEEIQGSGYFDLRKGTFVDDDEEDEDGEIDSDEEKSGEEGVTVSLCPLKKKHIKKWKKKKKHRCFYDHVESKEMHGGRYTGYIIKGLGVNTPDLPDSFVSECQIVPGKSVLGLMKYKHYSYEGPFYKGMKTTKEMNVYAMLREIGGNNRIIKTHVKEDEILFNDPYEIIIEYPNGDKYKGQVNKEKIRPILTPTSKLNHIVAEGVGYLEKADGSKLFGTFVNGKPDGPGISWGFNKSNSRIFGTFKNQQIVGNAVRFYEDGSLEHLKYSSRSEPVSGTRNILFSSGYELRGNWNVLEENKLPTKKCGKGKNNVLSTDLKVSLESLLLLKEQIDKQISRLSSADHLGMQTSRSVQKSGRVYRTPLHKNNSIWEPMIDLTRLRKHLLFHSMNNNNNDQVTFIERIFSQNEYLDDLIRMFCKYINTYYSPQTSSSTSSHEKTPNSTPPSTGKRSLVNIKMDMNTFVSFIQQSITRIMRSEPTLKKLITFKFPQMLYITMTDRLQIEVYEVLIGYYSRTYQDKEQRLKDKSNSILLALHSSAREPRVHVLKRKIEHLLESKIGYCQVDHNQLLALQKIATAFEKIEDFKLGFIKSVCKNNNKKYDDEEESESESEEETKEEEDGGGSNNIQKLQKCYSCEEILQLLLDNLTQKYDSIVYENRECPMRQSFKVALQEFALTTSLHDLDKSEMNNLREKLMRLRIIQNNIWHFRFLLVFEKITNTYFPGRFEAEFRNIIKGIRLGLKFVNDQKFRRLHDLEIDFCLHITSSLQEFIRAFVVENFEQASIVQRSILHRNKAILKGLRILMKHTSDDLKTQFIVPIIEDVSKLHLGSRKIRIKKVKELNTKLQQFYRHIPSDDDKVAIELLDSIYFCFTSVMDLFLTEQKFPLPFAVRRKNIAVTFNVMTGFFKYLSLRDQKQKVMDNLQLYEYFIHNFSTIWERILNTLVDPLEKGKKNENNMKKEEKVLPSVFDFSIAEEGKRTSQQVTMILYERFSKIIILLNSLKEVKKTKKRKKKKKDEEDEANINDQNNNNNSTHFFFTLKEELITNVNILIIMFRRTGMEKELKERLEKLSSSEEEREKEQITSLLEMIEGIDPFAKLRITESVVVLESFIKAYLIKTEFMEVLKSLSTINFIRQEFKNQRIQMIKKIFSELSSILYTCLNQGIGSILSENVRNDELTLSSNFVSLESLGIRKRFIPNYLTFETRMPYQKSMMKIIELSGKKSVLEKLRLMNEFERTVVKEMTKVSKKKPPFEEDDKLPIIMYIFMMTHSSAISTKMDHYIEYMFINDWNKEYNTMLSRYETYINYIRNLDPYARSGNNEFLTIVGNIIAPLKNEISKLQSDMQNVGVRLNLHWFDRILDYIYCNVGYMDQNEYELEIKTPTAAGEMDPRRKEIEIEKRMLSSSSSSSGKLKTTRRLSSKYTWVYYLELTHQHLNGICGCIGFYLRYDPELGNVIIVFSQKYSPQIYKKLRKRMVKEYREVMKRPPESVNWWDQK